MGRMKATLKTNHGTINLTLFPDHAPKTVKTITGLATGELEYKDDAGRTNPDKYYDGLIFHRIIPGFMIQGGCPLGVGMGGPGYNFDDEISPELNFKSPYMLAMANAGTRMGKGTNGSQFFLTFIPTPWLDGKHTVFGQITEGLDVLDKLQRVDPMRPSGTKPDVMERVTVLERG